MHDEMAKNYGLETTRMQLYRGKRKAMEAIEGNHAEAYTKLPMYAAEVLRTNPGSLVKIERERKPPSKPNLPHLLSTFKRIFLSFAAIQHGFKEGCRPFIAVDGCHLKGPFGGILLAAVGLDGNNGLYPIAIGVVESECKDSWAFFLYHLNTIFGNGPQNMPLTIMSDGQKGIEPAMRQVIPQATHRRCCRHIFSNLKGKFPGLKIKRAFWAAAKAYTVKDFNIAMGQMLELSSEAHSWLSKFLVEIWARHTFDHRVKSEHVTSNMVKSFNNWIGNVRGKPILTLLENIILKLMNKLHKRFEEAASWQSLVTPNIKKKLEKVVLQSRLCKVTFAGQEEYQVAEGVVSYIVNLQRRSCCCRIWDISGVPCKHATACITHKRINLETCCDTMYYKHIYFKAYGEIIHPMHDESLWGPVLGDELKPPPLKRMPGRPRKSRRREVDEAAPSKRSCTVKCIICKGIGHNKRTCQRALIRGREMGTNESAQRGIGTVVERSTIGRFTATKRSTVDDQGQDGVLPTQWSMTDFNHRNCFLYRGCWKELKTR
ncbi:unnamed protein product [Camellia sinensis]